MNRISFVLFTLLFYSVLSGYSSEKQIIKSINFEWKDINISKPYCLDCIYEDGTPDIPRIIKTFKLPYNPSTISVSIQNKIVESGEKKFLIKNNIDFGDNYEVSYETGVIKNTPIVILKIKPIVTEFGKIKLLKS